MKWNDLHLQEQLVYRITPKMLFFDVEKPEAERGEFYLSKFNESALKFNESALKNLLLNLTNLPLKI